MSHEEAAPDGRISGPVRLIIRWPGLLPLAALLLASTLWPAGLGRPQRDFQALLYAIAPLARGPSREVALVLATDECLDKLGRWPPPRRIWARTIDKLRAAGARAVGLDVLLLGPSEDDEAVARSMAAGVPVALPAVLSFEQVLQPDLSLATRLRQRAPLEGAKEMRARVGFANLALFGQAEEAAWVESIPLELRRGAETRSSFLRCIAAIGRSNPLPLRGRRIEPVPAAEDSVSLELLDVLYSGSSRSGRFTAWTLTQLLGGEHPPGAFRNRVILVGATAAGTTDLKSTPVGMLPGVEILANAVDNLLGDGGLSRPGGAIVAMLMGAIVLASGLLLPRMRPGRVALLLLAIVIAAGAALLRMGFSLPVSCAALAVLAPLCVTPLRRRIVARVVLRLGKELTLQNAPASRSNCDWLAGLPGLPGAQLMALTARAALAQGDLDGARGALERLSAAQLRVAELAHLVRDLLNVGMPRAARELILQSGHAAASAESELGKLLARIDEKLASSRWAPGGDVVRQIVPSRFRDLELIGTGGMAQVYKTYDSELARFVALKIVSPAAAGDQRVCGRFSREAAAAASLRHPHVVEVYESHAGPLPFLTMELLSGPTIRGHMEASGRLDPARALSIMRQIAEALGYAHERGIVHRDVKPENIMAARPGHWKLVDFGLALVTSATRMTLDGQTLGSLSYMAPEQYRGEDVGPAADVFSFGVTLYEMLAGRLPFLGAVSFALVQSMTPLELVVPGLPAEVTGVVARCLEPEPAARWRDGRALLAAMPGKNG